MDNGPDRERGSGSGLELEFEREVGAGAGVGVGVMDGAQTLGNSRERDERWSRSDTVHTDEGDYATSRRGIAASARTPYARRGSTGGMYGTAGTYQDSKPLPALTYPLGDRDRDGDGGRKGDMAREQVKQRDKVGSKGGEEGGKEGRKTGDKEGEKLKAAILESAEVAGILEAVQSSSGRESKQDTREGGRGGSRVGAALSYTANYTKRSAVLTSSNTNTSNTNTSARASTPNRSAPTAAASRMTSALTTLKDSITANSGITGRSKSGTASRVTRKRTDDWLSVCTSTTGTNTTPYGTDISTDESAELPRVTDVEVEAVKGWLWTLGLCVLDGEGGHYTLPLSLPLFPPGAYVFFMYFVTLSFCSYPVCILFIQYGFILIYSIF